MDFKVNYTCFWPWTLNFKIPALNFYFQLHDCILNFWQLISIFPLQTTDLHLWASDRGQEAKPLHSNWKYVRSNEHGINKVEKVVKSNSWKFKEGSNKATSQESNFKAISLVYWCYSHFVQQKVSAYLVLIWVKMINKSIT